MSPPESDVPYGTLDLIVLNTLAAIGSLHGYGIARRIEQVNNRRFDCSQPLKRPRFHFSLTL